MTFDKSQISNLRKKLHQHPELAFNEIKTASILTEFIKPYSPDHIVTEIGGTGIAFIFRGKPEKPTVLFRADLDALPIREESSIEHASLNENISHKCGHDGHMAMVASVAPALNSIEDRGDVILFFQPGEEVGEGAMRCMQDEKFKEVQPQFIFGMHNLPEYPAGKIILRDNTFACSSLGLKIEVFGKSSHAAQPDEALSPLPQVALISQQIENMNHLSNDADFFLSTLTHLKLGEESFGITPGRLTLFYTLRAARDEVLAEKKAQVIEVINSHFQKPYKLNIETLDVFPATINHEKAVNHLRDVCQKMGGDFEELNAPIRWSEDFGYYTREIPGAYFGLGIGSLHALHTPEYDFNDEVLQVGQKIYLGLIQSINK